MLQLQAGGTTNYATDTISLNITFGGLVAHYEFEGNVLDTSGNNNHGTAGGSPTFGSGVIGSQALSQLPEGSGDPEGCSAPSHGPTSSPDALVDQ